MRHLWKDALIANVNVAIIVTIPGLMIFAAGAKQNGEKMEGSSGIHPEQTNPTQPVQDDGYAGGVDLIRLISTEFGYSEMAITQNLLSQSQKGKPVEVWLDDKLYEPENKRERFKVPYKLAKGKTIAVVSESLHFRFEFKG